MYNVRAVEPLMLVALNVRASEQSEPTEKYGENTIIFRLRD